MNINVLKITINAYLHSVIDYGIEIWAVQSDKMLEELQNKIDRFICEFFVHKCAKRKYKLNNGYFYDKSYINELRKQCNFMTVLQRRDFVLLKCAFKDMTMGKCIFSLRSNLRKCPLMIVDNFSSQIYRKSVAFRTTKIWNTLPRDLDVKNMSYNLFKDFLHDDIFDRMQSVERI